MAHIPEITVLDVTDPRILQVLDISIYDSGLAITSPSLKVYIPNKSTPYYLPFAVGKLNTYTAFSFGITCTDSLPAIPDGIYSVTYSVSPNDSLYQTIKLLRTVSTKNKLLCILGDLYTNCDLKNFSVCNFNMNNRDQQIAYIDNLLQILESAEADVKNLKPEQGVNKLNWVNLEINKYLYNSVV